MAAESDAITLRPHTRNETVRLGGARGRGLVTFSEFSQTLCGRPVPGCKPVRGRKWVKGTEAVYDSTGCLWHKKFVVKADPTSGVPTGSLELVVNCCDSCVVGGMAVVSGGQRIESSAFFFPNEQKTQWRLLTPKGRPLETIIDQRMILRVARDTDSICWAIGLPDVPVKHLFRCSSQTKEERQALTLVWDGFTEAACGGEGDLIKRLTGFVETNKVVEQIAEEARRARGAQTASSDPETKTAASSDPESKPPDPVEVPMPRPVTSAPPPPEAPPNHSSSHMAQPESDYVDVLHELRCASSENGVTLIENKVYTSEVVESAAGGVLSGCRVDPERKWPSGTKPRQDNAGRIWHRYFSLKSNEGLVTRTLHVTVPCCDACLVGRLSTSDQDAAGNTSNASANIYMIAASDTENAVVLRNPKNRQLETVIGPDGVCRVAKDTNAIYWAFGDATEPPQYTVCVQASNKREKDALDLVWRGVEAMTMEPEAGLRRGRAVDDAYDIEEAAATLRIPVDERRRAKVVQAERNAACFDPVVGPGQSLVLAETEIRVAMDGTDGRGRVVFSRTAKYLDCVPIPGCQPDEKSRLWLAGTQPITDGDGAVWHTRVAVTSDESKDASILIVVPCCVSCNPGCIFARFGESHEPVKVMALAQGSSGDNGKWLMKAPDGRALETLADIHNAVHFGRDLDAIYWAPGPAGTRPERTFSIKARTPDERRHIEGVWRALYEMAREGVAAATERYNAALSPPEVLRVFLETHPEVKSAVTVPAKRLTKMERASVVACHDDGDEKNPRHWRVPLVPIEVDTAAVPVDADVPSPGKHELVLRSLRRRTVDHAQIILSERCLSLLGAPMYGCQADTNVEWVEGTQPRVGIDGHIWHRACVMWCANGPDGTTSSLTIFSPCASGCTEGRVTSRLNSKTVAASSACVVVDAFPGGIPLQSPSGATLPTVCDVSDSVRIAKDADAIYWAFGSFKQPQPSHLYSVHAKTPEERRVFTQAWRLLYELARRGPGAAAARTTLAIKNHAVIEAIASVAVHDEKIRLAGEAGVLARYDRDPLRVDPLMRPTAGLPLGWEASPDQLRALYQYFGDAGYVEDLIREARGRVETVREYQERMRRRDDPDLMD
jgi:hypothetical protein